ncbi:hypothetical protein B0H13DRAFT_1613703 [Mycena leptocephala]|nr:hypothetical protein B0H13DRAFT_1613703 [Mycena leptocephala]
MAGRGIHISFGLLGDLLKHVEFPSFDSGDVSDNIQLRIDLCEGHSASWLSQANHIFSRLGITSDSPDYALVQDVIFNVTISEALEHPPLGYLFVCPEKDVQIGPSSFRFPDCPAYWSLDPSGTERLSLEEATELGFPSIELTTAIWSHSWDADVYAALRQFHRAKGFDPDSQDWHSTYLCPYAEIISAGANGCKRSVWTAQSS